MKKGDKILALFLCTLCLALALLGFALFRNTGTVVKISQDNKMLYTLSLFENKTVHLKHNTVEIKNGSVDVIWADCKNQICVNHKKISKKGEGIICLPNRVTVEIE